MSSRSAIQSLRGLAIICALVACGRSGWSEEPKTRSVGALNTEKALDLEIAAGDANVFTVTAHKGQFIRVVAEQKGVDLILEIISPMGQKMVSMDSPNRDFGPESASVIAGEDGVYQIRVSTKAEHQVGGRYRIELAALRVPNDNDRLVLQAQEAFLQGQTDGRSGSKENVDRAITEYDLAGELWQKVGDRYQQALTLYATGKVYWSQGNYDRALACFNKSLPLRRESGDQDGEAISINAIAGVDEVLGRGNDALDLFNQALLIEREIGDHGMEAMTLGNVGFLYMNQGEGDKAVEYFNQALPEVKAMGDLSSEANTLGNLGRVYRSRGLKQKALEYYAQALKLRKDLDDRPAQAATLVDIAAVYSDLGDHRKALQMLNIALPIQHEAGHRDDEAFTLQRMGWSYRTIGELQKALELATKSQALFAETNNQSGKAGSLNLIGVLHRDLGDAQASIVFFNLTVDAFHNLRARDGEASALISLSGSYLEVDDFDKALNSAKQALTLAQAINDHYLEASAIDNIGIVMSRTGQFDKAIEFFNAVLPIFRFNGDSDGEAVALADLGVAYANHGDNKEAAEYYAQALPIYREVGDRAGEAMTLNNLRNAYRKTQPDLAVVFGKEAVNVLQSVRRDNKGLQTSLRTSYEKSIAIYYRDLADLLIERSRLGEAEEILNLLKDKEASDFIERDSVSDKLHSATLLDFEKNALDRYDAIADQIVKLGRRKAELIAKRDQSGLSDAEKEESKRLDTDLVAANTVLQKFLDEEQHTFSADSGVAKRLEEFKGSENLEGALQKLGRDVVSIYTLVSPDRYVAMLITSGARKAYSTNIREAEFNRKVFAFRQALQDPHANPLPLAQELYHIVFPEGLRQDLDAMHAKTIMWSIDNTLRYVPVAALHDGKDYLVKNFRQSLITPASIVHLTEDPASDWDGVGFGVSEGSAPLPSVPRELHGIFRDSSNGTAPIPGIIRLNRAFTRDQFVSDLSGRRNRVVHIATHFESRPGVAANSLLLLGDGELSLAEIQAQTRLFDGVDLLTLSACNTAFTNRDEDGREVDSFGTIAQNLGAKGVIASLWSVNDDSTASMMQTMYTLRQHNRGMSKSEAMREAQAMLLSGDVKPGGVSGQPLRGVIVGGSDSLQKEAKDWSHPYFWAPFILIGNWK